MDNGGDSAVLCLSGGMDSSILLVESLERGLQIQALSFCYGSKHNQQEIDCAKSLCECYQVPHDIVDLKDIGRLFSSSLLLGGSDIPEGSYNAQNMKATVVPFRNAVMLSVAVGYAESLGFQNVFIASHAGDHRVYPDCRPEFNAAFAQAALLGTDTEVKVQVPFSHLSKTQIALRAPEDFPFELTYTCYRGEEIHCGRCAACLERKEAIVQARGVDPTKYEI